MGIMEKAMKLFSRENAETPKISPGRNDACWCGSGRKYKKCHLAEDERKSTKAACSLNCGPT